MQNPQKLLQRPAPKCLLAFLASLSLSACLDDEVARNSQNISDLTEGAPTSDILIECLAIFELTRAHSDGRDAQFVQRSSAIISDMQPYAVLAITKENPDRKLAQIPQIFDRRMRDAIQSAVESVRDGEGQLKPKASDCIPIYERLQKFDRFLMLPNQLDIEAEWSKTN